MRRPMSIALRLALLFAAMAAAIFVAVGAYLYQTLAHQMHLRDDADLLNKAAVLRHALASEASAAALQARPARVLATVFGAGIVVRILASDGTTLTQNGNPPRDWRVLPFVALDRDPLLADIRELESPSGMVRAVGTLAATADGGAPLRVVIARERSERLAVLRRYAGDLVGALLAGAALATVLGFAIVRHGMRPLHEVVRKANDINAHRLTTRLSPDEVPAELRPLCIAFNAMLERLEEGVQRLAGFADDLAHDMRTPVNTLMVETQVALARPRSSDEYQELMVSNLEEYERLARMIENTLFLARADNARLRLEPALLDAQAELARVRDYFEGLALDSGVKLLLAPGHEDAPALYAEPILLQRAVSNLLSNAIAHTPPGGTVEIAVRHEDKVTAIDVANTGAGIAPEDASHIFDRYYRGDPARVGASSAGLGLSIVRAIMDLHQGEVSVDSRLGAVTTFTLRFPRPA